MRLKAPEKGVSQVSVEGASYKIDDDGHVDVGSGAHAQLLIDSHGFTVADNQEEAKSEPAAPEMTAEALEEASIKELKAYLSANSVTFEERKPRAYYQDLAMTTFEDKQPKE